MNFKTTYLGDVRPGQTVLLPCEGGFRTAEVTEVRRLSNGSLGLYAPRRDGIVGGPFYTGSDQRVAVLVP